MCCCMCRRALQKADAVVLETWLQTHVSLWWHSTAQDTHSCAHHAHHGDNDSVTLRVRVINFQLSQGSSAAHC